ncbi:unnamed protein product, partial [Heterosigma akashiwo]
GGHHAHQPAVRRRAEPGGQGQAAAGGQAAAPRARLVLFIPRRGARGRHPRG